MTGQAEATENSTAVQAKVETDNSSNDSDMRPTYPLPELVFDGTAQTQRDKCIGKRRDPETPIEAAELD